MVRRFRHVRRLQRLVRCANLWRGRRRHGHIKLHRRRRGDCHFDLAAINACMNHVAAPRARRNKYGSRRSRLDRRRRITEQNCRAAVAGSRAFVKGGPNLDTERRSVGYFLYTPLRSSSRREPSRRPDRSGQ